MEIIKETRNEFLKRKEFEAVKGSDASPSHEDIKGLIAQKFNVEAERIAVKAIKNNFGSRDFLVNFYIYDSNNDFKKLEVRNRKKKKGAK